jgi:hypothetical protein
VRCDTIVVKGRRMPLDTFIGDRRGPIVPSTCTLTTSRVPHELNSRQLSHYAKRFPLLKEIEAPWVSTRVNARLSESLVHSSVFSLACQVYVA